MSYILDALRRADAERERDPARGIHAQPGSVLRREPRVRRAAWIAAAAVLVVVTASAFYWSDREPERVAAASQVEVQALPAPVAPSQVPVAETAPPAPAIVPVATAILPPPPLPIVPVERAAPRTTIAPAVRPVLKASPERVAVTAVAGPMPVSTLPMPAPRPGGAPPATTPPPSTGASGRMPASPPPVALPPTGAPTTAPASTGAPATTGAPAATGAAATTGGSASPGAPATTGGTATTGTSPSAAAPSAPPRAGDRIVSVAELPPDVLREVPKLVISGGVHSDNAAQRMLIVGGQVRTEGAELAPGLVLEQIRVGSAVLRFRGWRYSVSY
jgi:general secretion pathway protein B